MPILYDKQQLKSTSIKQDPIPVTKCDNFDTGDLKFAPTVIDYNNSPYYQLAVGTENKSYKDRFGFKNLPISCLSIKNNYLTLTINARNITRKERKYIDFLKDMDNHLIKNKAELIKRSKINSHPDLYIHRPIIIETPTKVYINLGYVKDKNSNIVTKFTKNKIVSSISKDFIDFKTAEETYKEYKYVYVVFKAMARYSKNGDDGQRTCSIKLTALDVHLGEEYGNLNSNKDTNIHEIDSDDNIFVEI